MGLANMRFTQTRTYPMSTKRLLARADRQHKESVAREKAVGKLFKAYRQERLGLLKWQR